MKEVSKKTNKKILEGPNLTELGYNIEKEIKKANHFPYKTLLLVLLLVVIIGIITVYLLTPKITLNGPSKIEISYHDEYVEKGVDFAAKYTYDNAVKLNRMVCMLFEGYFKDVYENGIGEEQIPERVKLMVDDVDTIVMALANNLKGYKGYRK